MSLLNNVHYSNVQILSGHCLAFRTAFTLPKNVHIQYREVREVIYLSAFSIAMIVLNYVGGK